MMAACCCLTSGNGGKFLDLPTEQEHGRASRMTVLNAPGAIRRVGQEPQRRPPASGRRSFEEIKVGAVFVPAGVDQGLLLLHSDEVDLVVVTGVVDGSPWADWSASHPEHALHPADQIIEVNGRRGGRPLILDQLQAEPSKGRRLSLVVRRPLEHRVPLHKPEGDTLGLDLILLPSGLVFVGGVGDGGVVDGWNAMHPDASIGAMDQVVEVNRLRGTASDMVEALRQSGAEVELVVRSHFCADNRRTGR